MKLQDWHDSSHRRVHGARARRGSEPSNQLTGRSEPQDGALGLHRPDPNLGCLLLGGIALLGRATAQDPSLEQGQPLGAWSLKPGPLSVLQVTLCTATLICVCVIRGCSGTGETEVSGWDRGHLACKS